MHLLHWVLEHITVRPVRSTNDGNGFFGMTHELLSVALQGLKPGHCAGGGLVEHEDASVMHHRLYSRAVECGAESRSQEHIIHTSSGSKASELKLILVSRSLHPRSRPVDPKIDWRPTSK